MAKRLENLWSVKRLWKTVVISNNQNSGQKEHLNNMVLFISILPDMNATLWKLNLVKNLGCLCSLQPLMVVMNSITKLMKCFCLVWSVQQRVTNSTLDWLTSVFKKMFSSHSSTRWEIMETWCPTTSWLRTNKPIISNKSYLMQRNLQLN
jgi:hypothetical protein